MARAYTTFADGGKRIDGSIFGNEPRVVREIAVGGKTHTNNIVEKPVLSEEQAAIINDMLQGVVRYGTGKAAQLPGRQVAGKTGTTENYGDAWFVGYTPQLVAAVWVGYPDKLIPMTTEYHGGPVAGGTFPALIWKEFMSKALAPGGVQKAGLPPEMFTPPSYGYASPVTVVNRGGLLQRDDGVCHNTVQLEFFAGDGPDQVANCKPNEVEVPEVVGLTLAAARARLQAQPLGADVVYRPAKPGERVGYVLRQDPANGTASAGDDVTLILAKALHGVVPDVTGMPLAAARAKLEKLKLDVETTGEPDGRVSAQSVPPHSAAARGLRVTLTVGETAD
jgi:membrane peptidoglycan carboxypeptidase